MSSQLIFPQKFDFIKEVKSRAFSGRWMVGGGVGFSSVLFFKSSIHKAMKSQSFEEDGRQFLSKLIRQ